jgi:hypothetical protein
MAKVMVLNDGQTYSDLSGCRIVEIADAIADNPDIIEKVLEMLDEGAATSLGCELSFFDGSEGS